MDVIFYSFAKKINSTAQVSGAGSTYNCILKSDSSIVNPTIKLDMGQSGNPTSYNYAYIKEYSRYYFVHNWTWSGRLWQADLSCDVLASFRADILSSSQYVSRSATSRNTYIPDNIYPMGAETTYQEVSFTSPFSFSDWDDGSYIVTTVNGTGTASYYSLTYAQFVQLGIAIFNQALYTAGSASELLEKMGDDLFKSYFNPAQYITSVFWLPFEVTTTGTTTVMLGWYDTGASASYFNPSKLYIIGTGAIPRHPQYSTVAAPWINAAPWVEYYFVAQPFGILPLASDKIIGASAVSLEMGVDCLTGRAVVQIKDGDGHIITQTAAQVGVAIPLAGSTIDGSGIVSNIANMLGGATNIIGGNIGTGVAQAVGGAVGSFLNGLSPTVTATGAQGSTAKLSDPWKLYAVSHLISDFGPVRLGYPCCRYLTLDSLTGYTECNNPAVDVNCTDSEQQSILSYMASGFYIE